MSFELTNRLRKELASLDDVKGRRKTGLFVAEGSKCVLELAASFKPRYVFANAEWIEAHGHDISGVDVAELKQGQLRELTRLSTTPPVIACFELPEAAEVPSKEYFETHLVVALDRIQDPGNLGTILRTCDWMGVDIVLASRETVDAFNPKVVQSTMGGLARTKIVYTDLPQLLSGLGEDVAVYGTFLDGENIYTADLSLYGILVMGNEGQGISADVERYVSKRLLIPSYPGTATVESLNVATATAIALSQFRARTFN